MSVQSDFIHNIQSLKKLGSQQFKSSMIFFVLFVQILFILPSKCESCANITTDIIWPSLFREGIWYDQLRIYSAPPIFDTTSLFATRFETKCGFYELQSKSKMGFDLYKGYYTERFDEYFYPFMARVKANYDNISYSIFVERKFCDYYANSKRVAHQMNILSTDYASYVILHQCIDGNNCVMLLTQNENYITENDDKIGIEQAIVNIITQHNLGIENRIFVWSTKNDCRHHIEEIYPQFYRKKYIDRRQVECPLNSTIETIELEDYWWNKMEMENERVSEVKKRLIAIALFLVAVASILFVVYVFDSNFELY